MTPTTTRRRLPPPRTHCAAGACPKALEPEQRRRRRDYCSRACAKAAYWAAQPKARIVAQGQALRDLTRPGFLRRLRPFLRQASPLEAAARGWNNGFAEGARAARASGRRRLRTHLDRTATLTAIAASAPTTAEAFRQAYRAGHAAAWREHLSPAAFAVLEPKRVAARRGWNAGWDAHRHEPDYVPRPIGYHEERRRGLYRKRQRLEQIHAIAAAAATPDQAFARARAAGLEAARQESHGRSVAA